MSNELNPGYSHVSGSETKISMKLYDADQHNDFDRNLFEEKRSTIEFKNDCDQNKTNGEYFQSCSQCFRKIDRPYHSQETINEALNPPWAEHYEMKREVATPNFINMSKQNEPIRRLKSAPLVRSTPVLIIPEPRFENVFIPVVTTKISTLPPTPSRPKTRASSARARLASNVSNKRTHETKVSYRTDTSKLTNEETQQILTRVYGNENQRSTTNENQRSIEIIYTQAQAPTTTPAPVYVYKKSDSWHDEEISSTPAHKTIEISAAPLNPHYIHRPGVIAVTNVEKRSVVLDRSLPKKTIKHHRCHHKRSEPLLAVTSMSQKPKLSLEIDGVKLTHDKKLTLHDKSANLTKYFVDGRLYLIKDRCYNYFDNVDPSLLEEYNRNLALSQHEKCYRKLPVEKVQIVKSSSAIHPNTNLPQTTSKYFHDIVVDPNSISNNININKMSLRRRPSSAMAYT